MGVDLSLLKSFQNGGSSPVLRFYSWVPPGLSIGRFQEPSQDLDIAEINKLSIPIVRRITGGGAIWHYHEITYSLVCRMEDIGTRSVKESFKRLCEFLLLAYRELGLHADYALHQSEDTSSLGKKSVICFAGQELYDILIDGKKLGGNAQRRDGDVLFQHGSIPLELDRGSYEILFKEATLPQNSQITSLKECGITTPSTELISLLKKSFEKSLGIQLREDNLSAEEENQAKHYEDRQFRNSQWTLEAKL